jgi:hypothetical protein
MRRNLPIDSLYQVTGPASQSAKMPPARLSASHRQSARAFADGLANG